MSEKQCGIAGVTALPPEQKDGELKGAIMIDHELRKWFIEKALEKETGLNAIDSAKSMYEIIKNPDVKIVHGVSVWNPEEDEIESQELIDAGQEHNEVQTPEAEKVKPRKPKKSM